MGVLPDECIPVKGKAKTDQDERTENDNTYVKEAASTFSNGLYMYDVNNDMTFQDTYGFGCNITKKGSMQLDIF
eukprot:12126596-Ditylum_brightwellii.AAC.1